MRHRPQRHSGPSRWIIWLFAGLALGAPRAELRLGAADSTRTRAVLIYPAAPDEPTGLYFYLRGGRVDSVRGDEFNGFEGNSALHWFHTP